MKKIERFISGIADTVRGDIRAANALDEDEVYVTLKTKCGRIYIDYSASEPVVEVSHNGSYHESPNLTAAIAAALPDWDMVGDRIGQLVVMGKPSVVLEETDELSKSERGMGGFGSTGK